MKKNVGVVIRTKNEYRWIGYCLSGLLQQVDVNLSIVLVDCESDDYTVQNAKAIHPEINVINYKGEYFPGRAINMGVKVFSDIDYLVILSAHCVPLEKDWLLKFIKPLDEDHSIAGSYCRQIPTHASTPENRRDLINSFSTESRMQIKDSFFHNAASVIRYSSWKEMPFDESLKHIEDRFWAKEVLLNGGRIYYNAECVVVHEHGLNQHSHNYRSFRGEGVASLLDDPELMNVWLEFSKRESRVLVLILSSNQLDDEFIAELGKKKLKIEIAILPKRDQQIFFKSPYLMSRLDGWDALSLHDLMRQVLLKKIDQNNFFDYIFFIDGDKLEVKKASILDHFMLNSHLTGSDMCVQVKSYKEDFFMFESDEKSWRPLSKKLLGTYESKPHFKKALYGKGVLLRVDDVLQERMPKVMYFEE
jgi:GT2 family glycosyltransferase